ncbi:PDZK1-interacting protein 1 [Sceloporus undulatus]|uniref:PDZK1-interacting protein 1 n=1 Tax=Sceloporus undulatus TaxID=8520 RepID=UPI001C4C8A49|nr:PDZK1-interacting protein 1 [Sceloporus undulatus]
MKSLSTVTFCLLVALKPVNCQIGHGPLQPWMQGAIAVTVFLVLALVAFVVNRLWCQDKHNSLEGRNKEFSMEVNKEEVVISNGTEGRYSATAANFRCEEVPYVYENEVELECDNTAAHHGEKNPEVLTTCM